VEVEHLLLGALGGEAADGARTLAALGVDVEAVADRLTGLLDARRVE
jgi:hypothetical protein